MAAVIIYKLVMAAVVMWRWCYLHLPSFFLLVARELDQARTSGIGSSVQCWDMEIFPRLEFGTFFQFLEHNQGVGGWWGGLLRFTHQSLHNANSDRKAFQESKGISLHQEERFYFATCVLGPQKVGKMFCMLMNMRKVPWTNMLDP